MNRLRCTLLAAFTLVPLPVRAAPTVAPAAAGVVRMMRKVCDWQIANKKPKPDNNWVRATLYTGVMATYNTTHDKRYLAEAVRWSKEEGDWTPGGDKRFADNLCCGQTYAELSMHFHDPAMLAATRADFDAMIASPKPGRVDWWWCDSLFMAPPVLARLTEATGDHKYTTFLDKMWWDATDFLYDPAEHLYYRDKTFFDKRTAGGKKVFWSRGNGWVMAGTVRVLQCLPKDDPRRADYIKLHQDMAARIAALQGADGLWRTSLLDADEYPLPETSGTAFYCYALAWGINNGTLDRAKYLPVVVKAWNGLVGCVHPDGKLGFVQQVGAAPGSATADSTQEYAVGGFLLAGSEVAKLKTDASTTKPVDTWVPLKALPDAIAPYAQRFRTRLEIQSFIYPSGLNRNDYLKMITGEVDFWKSKQNVDGAIIDPYKHEEWQYSTPCYTLAAAALVANAGRTDLLESAAKAMDWSTLTLSEARAATHHEDFFTIQIAHALPLLEARVASKRAKLWRDRMARFDPYHVYRSGIGNQNWNVVALSGEWLLHKLGLRPDTRFIEESVRAQGRLFASPFGLYLEGPMAYDLFPRIWASDMAAHGYDGPHAADLDELLARGALTSLFMQAPSGELPVGGRSAQHQWNEAEECMLFEIYGAKAHAAGDDVMAGVYKRAAHLALSSMRRWVRPTGDMWIVKNHVDPEKRHGYEGYSAHSQYNLLPMAMLANAYEYAATTENVDERPAPADVGGYVIQIDPALHKVIANADGMYVEIDTAGDPHYDPTGLLRILHAGLDPELGLSQGLSAARVYEPHDGPKATAAIGAAWKDGGAWFPLAAASEISKVRLMDVHEEPNRVSFQLLYTGLFGGTDMVSERYTIMPTTVELTTELPDYHGPMRYVWPVLADDGVNKTKIDFYNGVVTAAVSGNTVTFEPIGASVHVEPMLYPYRNGWARLTVADYSKGGPITLHIETEMGVE